MNATTSAIPAAAARAAGRLSPTATFFLMASITVSFLAGASSPTALYPHYQAQWGFSPLAVTVIFGVYALAVLAALLVFGRLSDHIGRRPVLFASVAVQLVTMWMFAQADGLAMLLVARVLQGLSAGAAIAAVGAGLLDIDRSKGALANSITTPMGTSLGGVIGGLFVSLLPAPGQLVFIALGAVILLQGVALLWTEETTQRRPGALASLRPQLSLSASTRGPLLHAVPIIIATWAVAGFFTALGPTFIRSMTGANSALLSGLALFTMAGSAGVAAFALQHQTPRDAMRISGSALAAGMLVILSALYLSVPLLFYVGLIGTGIGFGSGFQGAVRSVVSQAHANERAGVLAVIFIIAYLAMGLPAIAAGFLLVKGNALPSVANEFATVIVLLALVPLLIPQNTRRIP
jgi:MFS family permease